MKSIVKRAALTAIIAAMIAICATPVFAATKVKSISLNTKAVTINVGKTNTLTVKTNPTDANLAKTATWKSSNSSVASVSKGKITAKKPGTAVITATVSGKSATCKVTVKAPVTSVKMNKTSASLTAGQKVTLTASFAPTNTTDSKTVTWTTSNSAVATVSKGVVTTKKAGTVKITAKIGSKTATCTVTVKAIKAEYVNVNECYTKVNTYRKQAKVGAVKKDAVLENIAKIRAKEIVQSFSHTRPNGQSGLSLITGNIYKGENIAKGQTSCAAAMTSWFNSSGHKANMLKSNYTKVGTAGYKYNGVIYWVQVFSS